MIKDKKTNLRESEGTMQNNLNYTHIIFSFKGVLLSVFVRKQNMERKIE